MDSINVVNLKIEKANAIKRFNRLRKIATLFRVIEILFIFIVVSRLSVQLPFKFTLSGEYFGRIYSALFSPRFVFVIGNVIVITLFLKSGWNSNSGSGPDSGPKKNSTDFYTEYAEKKSKQGNSNLNANQYSQSRVKQGTPILASAPNPDQFSSRFYPENIEKKVKQSTSTSGSGLNPNTNCSSSKFYFEKVENRVKQGTSKSGSGLYPNPNSFSTNFNFEDREKHSNSNSGSGLGLNPNSSRSSNDLYSEYVEKRGIKEKKMIRSMSEDLVREVPRKQFRRSETEMCRRNTAVKEEEEMSGEEFRRRVESFIARQQRNLREDLRDEQEFSALVS